MERGYLSPLHTFESLNKEIKRKIYHAFHNLVSVTFTQEFFFGHPVP